MRDVGFVSLDGSDRVQRGDPWEEWFCLLIGSRHVPFKMVSKCYKNRMICEAATKNILKMAPLKSSLKLDHILCIITNLYAFYEICNLFRPFKQISVESARTGFVATIMRSEERRVGKECLL